MALRAFHELNPRQQLAVLIGAPAVVAVILIFFVYRALGVLGDDPNDKLPRFIHRNAPGNLWAEIKSLDDQIAVEQTEIDKKPAIVKELASLDADIKAAQERLPLESEKAEMRLRIEKLARDIPSDIGTVQLLSVRIIEDSAPGGRDRGSDAPQKVTYQTEITGDLNGIIKYIDVLEKNPRFISVSAISIKPGGMSQDAEKKLIFAPHNVKMSLVTYVYNPNPGKGR